MKRILVVMLSAVMVVIMFVGCGDNAETGGGAERREKETVEQGADTQAADTQAEIVSESGLWEVRTAVVSLYDELDFEVEYNIAGNAVKFTGASEGNIYTMGEIEYDTAGNATKLTYYEHSDSGSIGQSFVDGMRESMMKLTAKYNIV